jgi:glutathione reductase (NADPH)
MAPTPAKKYDFDLVVIGGGSGGSGAARRAAKYGAKVAVIVCFPSLILASPDGGHRKRPTGWEALVSVCSCLPRSSFPKFLLLCSGCVPKKIMWHAKDVAAKIKAGPAYGFDVKLPSFDWLAIKEKRDAYIKRLNGIYLKNYQNDGVEPIFGRASFIGPNEVEVDLLEESGGPGKRRITAERICLAVGGRPTFPEIEGAELGISSDGFFDLEELPKRVVVVGAGYIAVEVRLRLVYGLY